VGVISGRILECYFPPPFYSLPPGEGKATFYEFVNIGQDISLEPSDFSTVLKDKELEKAKMTMKSLGHLYYIKLHGSYDWRDEQHRARMIIGMHKADQIGTDDILSWYFRLFEEVLSFITDFRRALTVILG